MAPLALSSGDPLPSNIPIMEEEYNSEEDSDFDIDAPDAAEEEGGDESASEAGGDNNRPRKRRKVTPIAVAEEEDVVIDGDGALDSGDEITIRRGKEKLERVRGKTKKSAKKAGSGSGDEEEEEGDDFVLDDDEGGGEGGFVRTRAMKAKIQEERRPLVSVDDSTIDVDAIWAKMTASTAAAMGTDTGTGTGTMNDGGKDTTMSDTRHHTASPATPTLPHTTSSEETITIKRTYKFAGEVITEEKTVPKDSAEAKLYLSSLETSKKKKAAAVADATNQEQQPQLRRPLRRYSRFDPNPPDAIKRSWEKQQQQVAMTGAKGEGQGPKLNTVMKSKLDWAAYVDKVGIQDELSTHSRAKEGYLGRMEFLGRVDAKEEEERRNARLKRMG
ncbi:hypothetical protein AJ80_09570 [Polytolypa hystricis UAMH7299]|uniref:SWR1-complex protein 5 n=1 Tax=Polytolypa hystricis (strain UAMH7299) TaxID=1447883 RepID=A0A2B7WNJ4_POLH7|nr:hypothetical protein AJ80_09570 [Polytolypa hystricis UAMH7299]